MATRDRPTFIAPSTNQAIICAVLLGGITAIYSSSIFSALIGATCCFLSISALRLHSNYLESLELQELNAHRMGSVLIPKIRGRLPGNIDILWKITIGDISRYPTETFMEWAEIYGLTFDMNILWSHQIVTGKYHMQL